MIFLRLRSVSIMSHNSEVLDAVNRAIDALIDLRTLLEQEAAAPAEPKQPAPKPETPELVLPEAETKQPEPAIELVAPEPIVIEPPENVFPELVHPEATEKEPQAPIELTQPDSVTAAMKTPISLELPGAVPAQDDPAPAPDQPLICPRCGKTVDHGFKFCMYCGEKLGSAPAQQLCRNCGKPIQPGNKFCVTCGTPVNG